MNSFKTETLLASHLNRRLWILVEAASSSKCQVSFAWRLGVIEKGFEVYFWIISADSIVVTSFPESTNALEVIFFSVNLYYTLGDHVVIIFNTKWQRLLNERAVFSEEVFDLFDFPEPLKGLGIHLPFSVDLDYTLGGSIINGHKFQY